MKLKSEMLSNLLKMLLWPLVILAALDLAAMAARAVDYDFFADYLYPAYGFMSILLAVLYSIIIVVYLIWLYRVHMDLNRLFPSFPRGPGGALACMLIPFYNLYGIPSIYMTIGTHLETETGQRVRKQGRWVRGLAVPLLLAIMIDNGLSRAVNRIDEPSDALLVSSSIFSLVAYTIFLLLCIFVSEGVKKAHDIQENAWTSADTAEA